MALWKYIKYRAACLLYGIDEPDEKERAIIIEASDLFAMRPDKKYLSKRERQSYVEFNINTLEKFERHCNYYNLWHDFCISSYISEGLFLKFQHQFGWDVYSKHQQLSENFIRRHKDKVKWSNISQFQKLSEKFIEEFKDYIDWNTLKFNANITFSESFKNKYSREFGPIIIHYSDRPDIEVNAYSSFEDLVIGKQLVKLFYNEVYMVNKNKSYYKIVEISMDKKEIWVE